MKEEQKNHSVFKDKGNNNTVDIYYFSAQHPCLIGRCGWAEDCQQEAVFQAPADKNQQVAKMGGEVFPRFYVQECVCGRRNSCWPKGENYDHIHKEYWAD